MTIRELVFEALDNVSEDEKLIPSPEDVDVKETCLSLIAYADGLEGEDPASLATWVWEWLISRGHVS